MPRRWKKTSKSLPEPSLFILLTRKRKMPWVKILKLEFILLTSIVVIIYTAVAATVITQSCPSMLFLPIYHELPVTLTLHAPHQLHSQRSRVIILRGREIKISTGEFNSLSFIIEKTKWPSSRWNSTIAPQRKQNSASMASRNTVNLWDSIEKPL